MSHPVYGRYQVAEPPHTLATLHLYDGATKLKTVDHEPHVAVLDQSDLITQGIFTDLLVKGAVRAAALGSCTANADIAHLSTILTPVEFAAFISRLINEEILGYEAFSNVVAAEKGAIVFYHDETMQTGDPATEWPPVDCGSSGPFIASESFRLKVCTSQVVTHAGTGLISLMQRNGVMMGSPWFNSWEEPDASGFIDGNGRQSDLQTAINSGIAGGHQTVLSAVERIAFLPAGQLDPFNTILRDRNSWSGSWGDSGSCRIHLSTLIWLSSYCDFRQLRK